MNNNKHAFFAAVCTLFIVACSPNITTEEYINNAKQSILNDKHTEAIIVLKKAIRKDPDNEELRLLLGNAYLNDGKSAEAEKELSLALNRLQANPSEVLPSLFKALHLQDKNIDIIKLSEQYSDTELPQTVLPEILMYRVYAHLRNGEREEAKRLVTLANEISTEGIYTNYSNALLQSNDSEVDNSLQLLEQVLAQKPDFAEAILLKGQLLLTNRDYAKAILAFKEYAALNPNDIKIHLFLANTYIKNNQYNEADDSLKILLPLVPYQPLLNHLKAVSSFKFKNYTAALEHAKVSIQNGLVTTPNRVIAGLSAFNLGHYEQAHQYLNPLRNELPKSHPVNKILVAVKMQLGYVEELESSIENIEGLSEEDVNLLTSASFEMLKKGNVEGAKATINKTDGMVGLNSADLTSIGILKLSMDDIDGITSLESALEGNPDLSVAKVALAAAYIQNNEFEKAHILASDWKLNNPDVVDGFNLAAKIYFTQGNKEAAEIELNKALEINKVNPFSILYFANESYLKGDYQEAVNQIDLMLPSYPDHLQALSLFYKNNKQIGGAEKALENIQASFKRNSGKIDYRLLLARALFSESKHSDVITLLNNVEQPKEALPDLYWKLLASSYSVTLDFDGAIKIYEEWLNYDQLNKDAWVRKIRLEEQKGDIASALTSSTIALSKMPTDAYLKALQAYYLIENDKAGDAEIALNKLNADEKLHPFVKGMIGRIALLNAEYMSALPNLKAFYNFNKSTKNATHVAFNLKALGRLKEAIDFLKLHVTDNNNDNISKMSLAELAIDVEPETSAKYYEELLALHPENGQIINNLAWVQYKLGDYQYANELVEKALLIFKEHPQVLDNSGLIKLKLGNKKVGIEHLKKAASLAPNDRDIHKHLEEALAQ